MNKTMQELTELFLSNRPVFFSLIRPLELKLWLERQHLLNGTILDFGCGDGFFAECLIKKIDRNLQMTAIDLLHSRVSQAKKLQIYGKVIEYNGLTLPFPDNSFNCVISNSVLEHVDDLSLAVSEIFRVLKPGGVFLTTVMTDNWEKGLLGRKVFGRFYARWLGRKQVHINLHSIENWEDQFTNNGFLVKDKACYLFPQQAHALELLHYFSVMSLISYSLFKKWILWPNLYKISPITSFIYQLNSKAFEQVSAKDSSQASAVFFVVKKPE